MSSPILSALPDTEQVILLPVDQLTARWRERTLARAGYDDTQVKLLAPRGEIDLHAAVDLVERGCPHALAVEILR
jgi:hypothetical protein